MATKNIVPNADGEGKLGTSSKSWAEGHIDSITGTIATAAQGSITSLGTLTTLTVDDITINGSTISDSGDLLFDIGGDISLDAAGGDFIFLVGGSQYGKINFLGTNNLTISGSAADHAGLSFATHAILPAEVSATTDGTIDLGASSEQFKTIFLSTGVVVANDGTIGSTGTANAISITSGGEVEFTGANHISGASSFRAQAKSGTLFLDTSADAQIRTNGTTTALTLDTSQNANFASGVAVAGASSLPLSDSSALNAGIQIPTNAQLGFGNGDGSKPDFGFAVQGTSGSAKLNIFCGTGGTDVDAFIDTNGFIHAAALFLGGESSPNTLDDYEEGTWDPVFVGSGGSQNVDNGYYRKVGSLCYLSCSINVDSARTSGETSSISGLPFTAATASNVVNAVSFYNVSTSFTGNNIPLGLIPSGSAQIALYITNGTNYKFNAVFNTGQVGSIEFSVTYITA